MNKSKIYVNGDITPNDAIKEIEKLEKIFPIGSIIALSFDTRKCVFRVNEYVYDDVRYTIAAKGDGINAANKLLFGNRFGLKTNYMRMATETEKAKLIAEINKSFNTIKSEFPSVTFMREDLIDHLGEELAMSLTDEQMEAIAEKVGEHILEYYDWQNDLNETCDFVLENIYGEKY